MESHTQEGAPSHSSSSGMGPGLSVTGLAVLFFVLRLFAVSEYNWHTAFSVAGTVDINDVVQILLGTLMAESAISGVVVMLLLPITLVYQIHLGKPRLRNAGTLVWLIILVVTAATLVFTFSMWWVLIGAALLTLLLCVLFYARVGVKGRAAAHWIIKRTHFAVAVALLIMAAAVTAPWMPLERIHTESGPVEGYVLEARAGYLTVLVRHDHETVILSNSHVEFREEIE